MMSDNNTISSEKYLNMDLLRFTTAGSVDDGKSTLIGRLLYDSKAIFADQMEAIEKTSEPQFVQELVQLKTSDSESEGRPLNNRDELYEAAIDVVVREGRGSVSLLQRSLGIGYGRAARLIDLRAAPTGPPPAGHDDQTRRPAIGQVECIRPACPPCRPCLAHRTYRPCLACRTCRPCPACRTCLPCLPCP